MRWALEARVMLAMLVAQTLHTVNGMLSAVNRRLAAWKLVARILEAGIA